MNGERFEVEVGAVMAGTKILAVNPARITHEESYLVECIHCKAQYIRIRRSLYMSVRNGGSGCKSCAITAAKAAKKKKTS